MRDFFPGKTKGFLAHTMEQQHFFYWGMGNPSSLAMKLLVQLKDQFNERKVTTLKFYSIL